MQATGGSEMKYASSPKKQRIESHLHRKDIELTQLFPRILSTRDTKVSSDLCTLALYAHLV